MEDATSDPLVPRLEPTPQKMLDVLSDWEPHTLAELRAVLSDTQATDSNVHPHLNAVRRHLHPQGMSVLCMFGAGKSRTGEVRYRLVSFKRNGVA